MNPKKSRNKCKFCGRECSKHVGVYCSNMCQTDFQYKEYIKMWLSGNINGNTKNGGISNHIRRWIIETRGQKCEDCGWSKVNKFSGKTPLEIDHINGNSLDNNPTNLRVFCPNCHSLTPTYKNLNNGKGMIHRRKNK